MAKSTPKKAVVKKEVGFTKDSIEAVAIKAIKGRQRKIDNAGNTLVGLWYEQGKELLELQMVLECSARALENHTGVKRSAIATYISIANDPRLGEPEIAKQLGQFTQKDLIKLGKIEDNDAFDKAVEEGKLPHVAGEEKSAVEVAEWLVHVKQILSASKSLEDFQKALEVYVTNPEPTEVEDVEPETVKEVNPDMELLLKAIAKTGEDEVESQALELDITVKQLTKALNEEKITQKIIDKCNTYLAE